ncbi:hypothetical protein N1F89_13355 [Aquibium sp. A9E412]|uniref:DUF6980 family protein n=1 Tax=Aquibium sp. A9E412 TaxID=2976767 RepID=UPI0025B213AD|nr:hypothetical protein [Aquibium sp. A9E412]MDN2567210.1 hypothetical protein [Aquibium sp. A9E412]
MSQRLFPGRRVLWMDPAGPPASFDAAPGPHCCAAMRAALSNDCAAHADDAFACPDMLISYSPAFNEYGLIVHDGGASSVVIDHCPFCGARLPQSLRARWFEALEALGVDDPLGAPDTVPAAYRSARWWQSGDDG